jgi:phage tail-like protein
MSAAITTTGRRLLSLLPGIYAQDPFLGRYLAAFEHVLVGLEKHIEELSTLFDPKQTRAEFLPWLSSWAAFTLRADINENQQRDFLARVVPLYRRRGTLQNMQELLTIFTRGDARVSDSSTPPHFFHVTISLPPLDTDARLRQIVIARALIDLEKPAHTEYSLEVLGPAMQVGVMSTIGVDTLLGVGRAR